MSTISEPRVGKCKNADCPFDGDAPGLEAFGMTIIGLCEGCAAELDSREKREQIEKDAAEFMGRVKVGQRIRAWSLATYPKDERGLKALGVATDWIERYRNGVRENLILFGDNGVGKTGLAWGIVRALIEEEGVEANFVIWRDLLAEMQTSFGSGRSDVSVRLRRVPVLALDDLGAEPPTDWRRDELATLIEFRYQWQLPMIVTSNYSLSELTRRLAGYDEQVLGLRLISRLRDGATGYRLAGADRRKKTRVV